MPLPLWIKEEFGSLNYKQFMHNLVAGKYDEALNLYASEILNYCVANDYRFIPLIENYWQKQLNTQKLNKCLQDLLNQHEKLDVRTGLITYDNGVMDEEWDHAYFNVAYTLIYHGADIETVAEGTNKTLINILLNYKHDNALRFRFIKKLIAYLHDKPNKTVVLTKALLVYVECFHESVRKLSRQIKDDDFFLLIFLLQAGANPQEKLDNKTVVTLGIFLTELSREITLSGLYRFLPVLIRAGCQYVGDLGNSKNDLKKTASLPHLESINLGLALLQYPGRNEFDFQFKADLLKAIRKVAPNIEAFWEAQNIPKIFSHNPPFILSHVNLDSLRLEVTAQARQESEMYQHALQSLRPEEMHNVMIRKGNTMYQLALLCLCMVEARHNKKLEQSRFANMPIDVLLLIVNMINPSLVPLIKAINDDYQYLRPLIGLRAGLTILQKGKTDTTIPVKFEYVLSATAFCRHFKSAPVSAERKSEKTEQSRKLTAARCFRSQITLFKSVAEHVKLIDDVGNHPAYEGVDLIGLCVGVGVKSHHERLAPNY